MYHTGLSVETLVEALFIIAISIPIIYGLNRLLKKALVKWWPRYLEEYA